MDYDGELDCYDPLMEDCLSDDDADFDQELENRLREEEEYWEDLYRQEELAEKARFEEMELNYEEDCVSIDPTGIDKIFSEVDAEKGEELIPQSLLEKYL